MQTFIYYEFNFYLDFMSFFSGILIMLHPDNQETLQLFFIHIVKMPNESHSTAQAHHEPH